MFFLLGWLPDGVSTSSRLPESLSTRRRIFHSHFFLLGKALKSCPARMGWLSGVSCAPNSDSKEEKEKRRPGDGNAHGPLASESSRKNDQDGLSGSQVLPVNQFLSRMWWQPFPRAWFCVSVTALQRRGPSRLVGPWRRSHHSVSEWMWESSPRKPEQLTESTGCSQAALYRSPPWALGYTGQLQTLPQYGSSFIRCVSCMPVLHGHRLCRFHLRAFQSLDPWPYHLWLKPTGVSFLPIFSMSMLVRILIASQWHYFQKREVVGVLCEILKRIITVEFITSIQLKDKTYRKKESVRSSLFY